MQASHGSVRGFEGMRQLGQVMEALTPLAVLVEGHALGAGGAFGYCRGCLGWRWFVQPEQVEGWANLTEGMLCDCGLNGRMRGVLGVVDEVLACAGSEHPAVVFERLTPMFRPLSWRMPGLTGSEYLGEGLVSGDYVECDGQSVRHESMQCSSYGEGTIGLVLHFDVLEHVPDPVAALRECYRILQPGGWLAFSTPFYEDLTTSICRARLSDGMLVHHLPAVYHGNPVDDGGALVFTQFGCDIFEMVSSVGFVEIEARLAFNPVEGVFSNGCPYPDGHAWPVVFVARKQISNT